MLLIFSLLPPLPLISHPHITPSQSSYQSSYLPYQCLWIHTFLPSPRIIHHSPLTCFFFPLLLLPFHFPVICVPLTSLPFCFTSFLFLFMLASCLSPGGLAVEYHHYRQLHEQVQPLVFLPAAAQTHGVEPQGCLVPPEENR